MERDWELIKKIMLRLEAGNENLLFASWAKQQVDYHIQLLVSAGYADALTINDDSGPVAYVGATLTWKGHDFLDAARDERVWNKFLRWPRPVEDIFEIARYYAELDRAQAEYEKVMKMHQTSAAVAANLTVADSIPRESPEARRVPYEDWSKLKGLSLPERREAPQREAELPGEDLPESWKA